MGQLAFQLPEIDRTETRRRVEEALETARLYKERGFVRREIKSTPSYEPRFHGATNAISKPVEDIATWNVDTEQRIKQTTEAVEKAISRLRNRERIVILKRYFEADPDELDSLVCHECMMSERTFGRIKARAIYNLAFMLELEVMLE